MEDDEPTTPSKIVAQVCAFWLLPLVLCPIAVVCVLPASTDFLFQTSGSLAVTFFTNIISVITFGAIGRRLFDSLKTGKLPTWSDKWFTILLTLAVFLLLTLGCLFTTKPMETAAIASDFNREYCLKQAAEACSDLEAASPLTLANLFNNEAVSPPLPRLGAKPIKDMFAGRHRSRLNAATKQAAASRAKAASACQVIATTSSSQMATWMMALYPPSGSLDRWCGSYLKVNNYQFPDGDDDSSKPKDPTSSSLPPGAESPFYRHGKKLLEPIQTVRRGRDLVRILYVYLVFLQIFVI